MKRIIYDHQIFALQQYGGISRYFCELAPRIHRSSEFGAAIVAPLHINDYLPSCQVEKWALQTPIRTGSQRLCRLVNQIVSPLAIRAMRPTLLHRTYYSPLLKPSKVPVVVTVYDMIHEIFANNFSPNDRTTEDKRLSLERADHVICISESTANDLVGLFGISRDKLSVTHLGYSSVFTQSSIADASPHSRPYLLYVGHRTGYKNFDVALRAYAMSQSLREEFDLVVFGGPPLDAEDYRRFNSLGLRQSQVTQLSGSDQALGRAYRHARSFVYPSKYEGFGIPPLEAMGSGCPVACSNTSSIPEVVGDAAALFDPEDVDSVRLALESASLSEATRARLVAAGHARARLFSWENCATDTLAVYRKILGMPTQ